MKKFLGDTKIRAVLLLLSGLIVLLIVFGLGISVGYSRAGFAAHFDRNFDRMGMMGGLMQMNIHGIAGAVIDVTTSTLMVEDQNNDEHFINVNPETVIRKMEDTILITDIQGGDHVAVIGDPNDQGQIEARFIRVFSASSSSMPGVHMVGGQ